MHRRAALLWGISLALSAGFLVGCGGGRSQEEEAEDAIASANAQAVSAAVSAETHAQLVAIAASDEQALVDDLNVAAVELRAASNEMTAMMAAVVSHFLLSAGGAAVQLERAEGDVAGLRAMAQQFDDWVARYHQYGDDFTRLALPGHDHGEHFHRHAEQLSEAGAALDRLADRLEDTIAAQRRVTGR